MADTDVLKMKVADLKRELKLRGLSITGNKTELQDRLQTVLIDGELSLEDTAISEDLLDEDVLSDEEAESAALESPLEEEEKNILSPQSEIDLKLIEPKQPAKKVILKRKTSLTIPSPITPTTINNEMLPSAEKITKIEYNDSSSKTTSSNGNNEQSTDEGEKKVVKVSQLSMQERLDMRAKKFGIKECPPVVIGSVDLTITNPSKTEIDQTSQDPKVIEALKKRAERFGCVVSPQIVEIEKAEKLQKRAERFGTNSTTKLSADNSIYAEKAKLRLERFKTAAK